MNLIPWRQKKVSAGVSEASPLATLRSEMDRLFDSYMKGPVGEAWDWAFGARQGWPAIDISETEKEIVVQAELPGMDSKDIEITLSGNQLVLSGEKKQFSESHGESSYHSERCYGVFRRSVPLPEPVEEDKVQAEYSHGLLTVRLPKTRPANVKRIEVKTQ